MKGKPTRANRRDEHTLAGAYAMDAISAKERDRFERHLARCEECAQEIASLRETTALLGAAAAEPLPAGLKERVMAAATMTRQQPPADEAEAGANARHRRALLASSQVPLEPVPVLSRDGVHRVRADQRVRVPFAGSGQLVFHWPTPRQSRSRISASRILVFTVPVGTPSRLATWP